MLCVSGTRHQEDILDERFTALSTVNDLLVHGDYLYVAYENGLSRFLITYQWETTPADS